MAVKNVVVCPKCKAKRIDYGDGVCVICHGELIKTKYTELFWDKITDEEKQEYINAICESAITNADEYRAPSVLEYEESFKDLFSAVKEELDAEKPVFDLVGNRGRLIKIYEDKVEITTEVTLGSIMTNNASDGTKTIYFRDVIGVQFKYAGFLIGYLQFETANSAQNNTNSNFFNENTFTFEEKNYSNKFMHNVYLYVISRMNKIKRDT